MDSNADSSTIGVKQGDLLGPELFTFFMAGVMETWRASHDYMNFVSWEHGRTSHFILTGRNPNTGGKNVFGKQYTEFAVTDSEYADDTAIPFCNRADAEKYTPLLIEHFRRWGLEVHAGSYHPFKGSKTELLFCSCPLSTYQDPSTCDNTDMTDLILPNGRFVYPWWPSSNTSAPIFQAMDPTQSMSNLGSILQLVPLEHYPNAHFDLKTLIVKPKAQSMHLWFYQFAYMGAKVGALPKSCTPSFANFTLDV